jgi:hypothetical protein
MKTNNKTVFNEYGTAARGQHFITVSQILNGNRIYIGKIYREYDPEVQKYTYRATDFGGNQVFADYKDLFAIKKGFIEHGESMAHSMPKSPNKAKQAKVQVFVPRVQRNNELKNIREKKSEKDKMKEVIKTKPKVKKDADQKEKEQGSKNPAKYKDAEHSKEERDPKENEQKQDITNAETENQATDEFVDNEVSEREAELDEIREQGSDLEEDIER